MGVPSKMDMSKDRDSQSADSAWLGYLARYGIILLLGLIFLILALAWDYRINQASYALASGAAEDFNWRALIFNEKTGVSILKEIAFALIIALAIMVGIDQRARDQDNKHASNLRHQISEDVFFAIFQREFSRQYVSKIVETNLKSPLMRDFISMEYVLDELPDEIKELAGNNHNKLVLLRARTHYRLRNISGHKITETINFALADREGSLTGLAKILSLQIDNKTYNAEEIESLKTKQDSDMVHYCWDWDFETDDFVEILVEHQMLKDLSDNEVWGSYHPTLKMEFTARINVSGLKTGVRSLCASKVSHIWEKPDYRQWVLDGPTLPHDSVTFWWRPVENEQREGYVITEPDAESASDDNGEPYEREVRSCEPEPPALNAKRQT